MKITVFKKGEYNTGSPKNIEWSDLVNELNSTKYTTETLAEYKNKSKKVQNGIKHIGAIFGGTLKDNYRKNENVINRTILTLDVDNFKDDIQNFWSDFTVMFAGNAILLYTTHSHGVKGNCFRVLMPFSKEVSADQYKAIASYVADKYDLDVFDNVSYTPAQLFYKPSTAKDGEFIALQQEGEPLDVDAILHEYDDYTDVSEWAITKKGINRGNGNRKKDPTSLGSAVGAFCRTLNVYDAIDTFLSDVYEPTVEKDRYTYKNGSSYGGLIVYGDGLFAYSHHGTDPAGEQTLNAYDLVRVHRFGHLDEGEKEDTPINRKKSTIAMDEWITSCKGENEEETELLKQIKLELINSRNSTASASDDFEGLEVDERATIKAEIIPKLEATSKGVILPTTSNIDLIVNELYGDVFKFDLFTHKAIRVANVPWWNGVKEKQLKDGEITDWFDDDTDNLLIEIEKEFNMNINYSKARLIIDRAIKRRSFNPLVDILKSRPWDGVERAERLLIDYLGATDNEYTRLVTKHMLHGIVKRALEHGCKYDEAVVLIGKQGVGKSLLTIKLAINQKWHTDSLNSFDPKKGGEIIESAWIVELGELDAMRKAEVTEVKRFITAQSDKYRRAYARTAVDVPRKCVFIGTTNEDEFLHDSSGNRRFLPIRCQEENRTKHPATLTSEEVQQIYAEVIERWYKPHEPLYMDSRLKELATERQKEHLQEDIRLQDVINYVNKPIPPEFDTWEKVQRKNWISHITASAPSEFNSWSDDKKLKWYAENHDDVYQEFKGIKDLVLPTRLSVKEILEEGLNIDTRLLKPHEMRSFSNLVKQLGWEKSSTGAKKSTKAYGQQRVFERPNH